MKKRYIILIVFIVLGAVVVGLRLYLPHWLENRIEQGLKKGKRTTGSISGVNLDLIGGTMTLKNLKIFRNDTRELIPHFTCDRIRMHIRWSDLIQGRVEGKAVADHPVLTFVARLKYGGRNKDWTRPIQDLFPFRINRLTIKEGEIHYRNTESNPEVDVYLKDIHIDATDLTNRSDPASSMPSGISASATSVGNGKLELNGKMNVLMKVPDMDLDLSLEHVDITALNDLLKKYAGVDATKGTLNLYAEILTDSGMADGYVKPEISDLELVNREEKNDDFLEATWEGMAGFMIDVFENQKKDKFATKIPFSSNLKNIQTGVMKAIWNLFENAFIDAFKNSTGNTIGSNKKWPVPGHINGDSGPIHTYLVKTDPDMGKDIPE